MNERTLNRRMIEIKFEQHLNIQNTELGFDLEVAEVRLKKS